MSKPVIVSGCGRSGSHWLGHIMMEVFGDGAVFENRDYQNIEHIVVDSRLRHQIRDIANDGHRVVHLTRDGRNVVRSIYAWYGGGKNFAECCAEWADALRMMQGFPVVRLEDLVKRRDPTVRHRIAHWEQWTDEHRKTFEDICGEGMKALGYDR